MKHKTKNKNKKSTEREAGLSYATHRSRALDKMERKAFEKIKKTKSLDIKQFLE